MHANVKANVSSAGLNPFLDAMVQYSGHVDITLVSALGECFWRTTHTFHFSQFSKMTLTPEDFSMITGLAFETYSFK
jgi:hypothetical protein